MGRIDPTALGEASCGTARIGTIATRQRKLIAATALVRGFIVVTRSTRLPKSGREGVWSIRL